MAGPTPEQLRQLQALSGSQPVSQAPSQGPSPEQLKQLQSMSGPAPQPKKEEPYSQEQIAFLKQQGWRDQDIQHLIEQERNRVTPEMGTLADAGKGVVRAGVQAVEEVPQMWGAVGEFMNEHPNVARVARAAPGAGAVVGLSQRYAEDLQGVDLPKPDAPDTIAGQLGVAAGTAGALAVGGAGPKLVGKAGEKLVERGIRKRIAKGNVDTFADAAGISRGVDDSIDMSKVEVAGNRVRKTLRGNKDAALKQVNDKFEHAKKMKGADDALESGDFFKQTDELFENNPDLPVSLKKELGLLRQGDLNLLKGEEYRKALSKARRVTTDPEKRHAISELISTYDNHVIASTDSPAAKAFEQGRRLRLDVAKDFEARDVVDDIIKSKKFTTDHVKDAKIISRIFVPTDANDFENIRRMKKALTPKQWEEVSSTFARNYLSDLEDVDGLVKAIDKLGAKKLSVIFDTNPEALRSAIKIARNAQKVKSPGGKRAMMGKVFEKVSDVAWKAGLTIGGAATGYRALTTE